MNKLLKIAAGTAIALVVAAGLGIGQADAHGIHGPGGGHGYGGHYWGHGWGHWGHYGFYRGYGFPGPCWVTPYGTVYCGP
jgi:hypothetical protein